MSHWAADYIGDTWEAGVHDCWAFFRQVQAVHFSRAVPEIGVDVEDIRAVAREIQGNRERRNWQPALVPIEGDAVLLAHARYPSHVGVWVDADGGGVLHCVRGAGVIFSTVQALRAAGWAHIRYYRYAC